MVYDDVVVGGSADHHHGPVLALVGVLLDVGKGGGGRQPLGGREPADYLGQLVSDVGVAIAQEDVTGTVSRDVLETLTARREATSGVSLDEEALELIRNQRAYEAGARFLQVLNELTELTVNLV